MRVAWFSPLPPATSGIATYTAEIVPLLATRFGSIDLYSVPRGQSGALPPTEFVWRHGRQPYDLTVYQLGNSAAHDFLWAYLYRYPGLVVLHDAQVHQARALWLLRRLEPRLQDYLAEVRASHPQAPPDLGHLFAAGLGGDLFRLWPLVSLVLGRSRLTLVHNARVADDLARANPDAAITAFEMGTADPRMHTVDAAAVRRRFGIKAEDVVVGAYGGITPEKRIPQLLEAVAALHHSLPLHVLLVGARAGHYDVGADIAQLGLGGRVHLAGYVADADLPSHLAAADICWCLRWPSYGETSASWLRCLAAGRPTILTALAQLMDVPVLASGPHDSLELRAEDSAIGVAIDPMDESHAIPRVLAALATRPALRRRLGDAARLYWQARHTLPQMADAYEAVMRDASTRPAPPFPLPPHLLDDGTRKARAILTDMGVTAQPW